MFFEIAEEIGKAGERKKGNNFFSMAPAFVVMSGNEPDAYEAVQIESLSNEKAMISTTPAEGERSSILF